MTTQQPLPEGYAVAQLSDKRWYPLKVDSYYDACYPDGHLSFFAYHDAAGQVISFTRRSAALEHCQLKEQRDERIEQGDWQHLAVESDVYPERYAHYIDLIETITGYAPMIDRWYSHITIYVPSYFCVCKHYHRHVATSDQWAIEDALQKVAEEVYANYQACPCSQMEPQPILLGA